MINMINKKEFDKVTNATPDSHWSCLSFCCHFAIEQKRKKKDKIAKTRQTRYQISKCCSFVCCVFMFCYCKFSFFCKTPVFIICVPDILFDFSLKEVYVPCHRNILCLVYFHVYLGFIHLISLTSVSLIFIDEKPIGWLRGLCKSRRGATLCLFLLILFHSFMTPQSLAVGTQPQCQLKLDEFVLYVKHFVFFMFWTILRTTSLQTYTYLV